jgi:hypothetical protein
LIESLVPLIAQTVIDAYNVQNPYIVRLLMIHARWLESLSMDTASACRAFVNCLECPSEMTLIGSNDVYKVPHLLRQLQLGMSDANAADYAYFSSIATQLPHLRVDGIRSLVLHLSIECLSSKAMASSMTSLFPNVEGLRLYYRVPTGLAKSSDHIQSGKLKVWTTAFSRLKTFRVSPVNECDSSMCLFSQTKDEYFADFPTSVAYISVEDGRGQTMWRTVAQQDRFTVVGQRVGQ